MKSILVIEDEQSLLDIIKVYFQKEGFEVFTANNGEKGLEVFKKEHIDIVLSDIMMPKMDGFELAKQIRFLSDVPIILLTALDSEKDQQRGYELNIDEYVTKPFSPSILVLKVKAILKRINPNVEKNDIITYEGLKINIPAHSVSIDNKRLHLSKTEFDLLAYMAQRPDQAIDRVTFLDDVWGMDVYVEERVIDTNIKVLRKKLGPYSHYIQTVFGIGYKFEPNN
jgi:two-component system response regulator VanR